MQLIAERFEQAFRINRLGEPAVNTAGPKSDVHFLWSHSAHRKQLYFAVVWIVAARCAVSELAVTPNM